MWELYVIYGVSEPEYNRIR